VNLTGLAQNTTYTFQVRAHDAANNQQTSSAMTLHTLVFVPDNTPPTVSITSPAAGPVVGAVNFNANATDNIGVDNVEFRIDGALIGTADITSPYGVTWNSTTVEDGTHTLSIVGRDTSNNTASASVVVTVSNQPPTNVPHFVDLDGVDDFVQVADAPNLSFGTGTTDSAFTIEMRIRADNVNAKRQLIGKWGEGTNQEYRVYFAAGTLRVDLRDQSSGGLASVFTSLLNLSTLLGSWHHVAVTYDGRGGATAADGIAIYVDGALQGVFRINDAAYVAMENGTAPLEMGREGPQWNMYDGGMDDVRIWNVARTVTQIQGTMNNELAGTETGLIAYWRFNEGLGVRVNDDSPSTNTATLMSGVTWVAGSSMP
jgi:hypothetical protein